MSEANNPKPKVYRRSSLKSRRINIKPNPIGELKKNGKRRSISWGQINTFEFNENKPTFQENTEIVKEQTKEEEERHKKFLENRRRSISNEFISEKEMLRICKNLVDEIFDEERKSTGNDDLGEISESGESDKKQKNKEKNKKDKKDKKSKRKESSESSSSSSSNSYYSSCSCSSCQRRKESLKKEKEKEKNKEKNKKSKKNDKKSEKKDSKPEKKQEKKTLKSKGKEKEKEKEKVKEKEKEEIKKNKNVEKQVDGKKVLKEKIVKKEEKIENKKEKPKKEEPAKKEEKKEIVMSEIKKNSKVRLISYKDARELDLDTVAYIVLTDGSVLVVRKEYESESQDLYRKKVNKKTRNIPIRVMKTNYESFNDNNVIRSNQAPQFQMPNFKKMIFQKEIQEQPVPIPYPKQNYSFNTQIYPNNFLYQSNKKNLKKNNVSVKLSKSSISPPWKIVKDVKPLNFMTPTNIEKEKYLTRNYVVSQENMTQPNINDQYSRFIKISPLRQPPSNKYTVINAIPYYETSSNQIIDNSQTNPDMVLYQDLDSEPNFSQYNQYKNARNPSLAYSPIKGNYSENNYNSFEQDSNI